MDERADREDHPGALDTDQEIAALRAILNDPERRHLAALQTRLDDLDHRAQDVGEVLPQVLSRHAHDPAIARALTPALERAVTTSVRRNPKPLADALFPIMGPAIRKAVAASLASMVESLNRTLEHSFSRRSIRWRIEAFRTGKSFAEVVLIKTLIFRVEQMLLIDRKTGLLLQHAHARAAGMQDADMVSGMLTAIRDFVQDSFSVSTDDSLESLKVGELAVWIEAGPYAILAAVIRGSAPRDFRRVLQDNVERIHLEFGQSLESFNGDASAFGESLPILEDCLRTEYRADERKRGSAGVWVVAGVVVALLLLWTGLSYRSAARESRYLAALRAEPGITIVSTAREGGKFVVTGLRDPMSRDPKTLVDGTGLSADDVEGRWTPYLSLDQSLVLARAVEVLKPPAGTALVLNRGTLSASGTPSVAWVREARRLAPMVAGVTSFDAAGTLEAMTTAVVTRIEARAFLFHKGSTQPVDGQHESMNGGAADLRALDDLADAMGVRMRVDIAGHTDSDGPAESNLSLSRARAAVVQAAVARESFRSLDIAVAGLGSSLPVVLSQNEGDKQQNRRVTMRVTRPAR